VAHGPVVAAVMGLRGQEDLFTASLHYFAYEPFTGAAKVITLAAGSILAIPGRSIDIVNSQIDALVHNGNGLVPHAHLLNSSLGTEAVDAHTFPGSSKGPLRDFHHCSSITSSACARLQAAQQGRHTHGGSTGDQLP